MKQAKRKRAQVPKDDDENNENLTNSIPQNPKTPPLKQGIEKSKIIHKMAEPFNISHINSNILCYRL